MYIENNTVYNFSCNKQKLYDASTHVNRNGKYLFGMDICTGDINKSEPEVTLYFESLSDIDLFKNALNTFMKFCEGMVD